MEPIQIRVADYLNLRNVLLTQRVDDTFVCPRCQHIVPITYHKNEIRNLSDMDQNLICTACNHGYNILL